MSYQPGKVTDIWRYPVKSMLGERLDEASIGTDGIEGDRAWSLVEANSGISLTARRRPELLMAQARFISADEVVITLPDGTETDSDEDLTSWLGQSVELRQATPESTGTFQTQADATETGEWFEWNGPTGSFHDSTKTKVSLVSLQTLGEWDRRRFRINVITDGHSEDTLVERRLSIGGSVVLDVLKQIDRCVMVTRPQPGLMGEPELARHLDVLKSISRDRGGLLGIGALVEHTGTISVGDSLEVSG